LAQRLFSRAGFVAGATTLLLFMAAASRLFPALAQTPVDPHSPAGVATVNAAAFALSDDAERPAFVPGELLVGMQAVAAPSFAGALSASGFAVESIVSADAEAVTQLVNVPAGEELAAAREIAAQPGVLFVEPNYYVYATQDEAIPADLDGVADINLAGSPPAPYLVNDTFYTGEQWNLQRIDAARAWQLALTSGKFSTPSSEIVVAVVDSGIDPSHPDFAGRLLAGKNYVEIGEEPFAMCQEPRFNVPMLDTYGHGTLVAGIVAAATNNGAGVAGIAPMVKIDPRRVLNCGGSGNIADVSAAIREAADAGADIINLSLTVQFFSQSLADAVTYADGKGALLVAASGNNNQHVYYPAALPEVIAVGALDYFDDATFYSNAGTEIALAAPGGDPLHPVFSTYPKPASFPIENGQPRTRCAALRQDHGGYYCTNYGTSFAAPAVAGVAALLLSLDPSVTSDEVRQILVSTTHPLPLQNLDKVGAGKLNAYGAVRALIRPTPNFSQNGYFAEVLPTDQPYTVTVRIENPSTTSLTWKAQLATSDAQAAGETHGADANASWLTLTSGVNNVQNGNAAWGAPGFLTLRFIPLAMQNGLNGSQLTVESTPPGQSRTTIQSRVSAYLGELLAKIFLPRVMNLGTPNGTIPLFPAEPNPPFPLPLPNVTESDVSSIVAPASGEEDIEVTSAEDSATFAWIAPDAASNVQTHTLAPNGDIAIPLPFTVVVKGEVYQTIRIHENGFVVLPNSPIVADLTGENRCLPMTDANGAAIFGWWSDLDSTAAGARITSFTATGGRYVVQYENLPAMGAPQPYKVSFQIVLDQKGNVRFNYRDIPDPVGKPTPATIGVQALNGRFYSELLCSTPTQTFGYAPSPRESIIFRSIDLY